MATPDEKDAKLYPPDSRKDEGDLSGGGSVVTIDNGPGPNAPSPASEKQTKRTPFWKKKGKDDRLNEKHVDDERDADGEKKKVEAAVKPVPLWRMFRFATPFELTLNAIGIVLAIAVGAAQPLMTLIFGKLTVAFTNFGSIADEIMRSGETPELLARLDDAKRTLKHDAGMNAVWLVVIGLGIFVCNYTYMLIWNYTSEKQGKRVRAEYLAAVLRQEVAFFDDVGSGEIAARIQSDCHLVQAGVGEKIPIGVQYISTFVSGFVIAYARSPRLAGVLTAIFPPILISGGIMDWALAHYTTKSLSVVSKASNLSEEVFSSIRTVHAFCTQSRLGGKFDALIAQSRKNGIKNSFFDGGALAFMFFSVFVSYALAFFYGGILLVQGKADVGIIINVLFSIIIGSFSLSMITPVLQAVARGKAAAAKVFETVDRVSAIDSEADAGDRPDTVVGEFKLEHVNFHYPSRPSVQVLKDFSAVFPPGKTVALVGSSGSGKSTIVQLLERFYDPASGTVTLDGRDLRTLNVRWLRQQIGYVSQEPTLFATSVRENVEYGLIGSPYENASDEERLRLVTEACRQANADGFIGTLPLGYDTNVGERGMLLSGGQKQRVAIARAIVSNPRILLLDEATSALDGVSERVVQRALDSASQGRTTVVIAHRLATIKDADAILVMAHGEIVEAGTHSELLAREGVYATLVQNQKLAESEAAQGQQDEDEDDDDVVVMKKDEAEERPGLERQKSRMSITGDEETPSRQAFFRLARRVLALGRNERWWYITGFVGAVCCGMVFPAIEIIFGKAVEKFQLPDVHEVQRELNRLALWYFITALIAGVATFFQYAPFSSLGWNISSRIRELTFAAIMRHDIAWFDSQNVGALTGALADDPQKIQGLFGMTLGQITQSVTTVIGGAIIGLAYAPLLALIGIACLPLIIGSGYIRLRVVEQKDQRTKKWHRQSAQQATEAASNVRVVASLTRQAAILRDYERALEGPYALSIRTAWGAQALYSASQAMSYFVIALVFYVGALWLADGRYGTAAFFTTLAATVFCAIQAGDMFQYVPDASKAAGSAANVFSLLDNRPHIDAQDAGGAAPPDPPRPGHVALQNVKFRYPTRRDVPVLEDLSIDARPGQYVALVGPSGCGKSTAIQLLERFYDPLAGAVLLDGADVRTLNVAAYRSQIALVSQEPTLYAGSIRFNVLLGSPAPQAVSEQQLRQACADAHILEFIDGLPDGFDTDVGGKGAQLSGGQKQRIAIARALIRNPRILLLDEATAALDSASEKAVQAALDNAREGRTVIAIAHRLSTIQNADCIYYLDKGRVAEQGTHDELIARKGKYAELVQIQSLTQSQL